MILVKAAPVLTSRLDESMCGSSIRIDGTVAPPIIGVRLNGTNGSAAIPDTDNGSYDRDTVWDRAVGPFQFIPSSWAIYGQDGNGDGDRNPNNVYDAVPAVVAHLCPTGTVTDIEAAIFAYNRSTAYVQLVLEWEAWLEQARDPTPGTTARHPVSTTDDATTIQRPAERSSKRPELSRETMTVPEVAQLLGISRSTAYELARSGQIPALRLGRRIVIPTRALDALLSSVTDPQAG